MRKIGATAATILLAVLAACQQGGSTSPEEEVTIYEGVPTIRNGGDVTIDGVNIRLDNIDACELGQVARQANHDFDCGLWARDQFRALIGLRSIQCESSEIGTGGQPLATCYVGDREINRVLVDHGYVFLEADSSLYRGAQADAQEGRRGICLFETVEHPSGYRSGRGSRQ